MPLNEADIDAKIRAKFGNRSARTGGKCSVRRKFKAQSKSANQDDKRLLTQLKKLNVTQIPAIEEVNLFKDDGSVVHFTKPKVQAEIQSNTYIISGECETKKVEELIPQILPQLGSEHIEHLKNFAQQFKNMGMNNMGLNNMGGLSEDDVPQLVGEENFEQVAGRDEKNENEQPLASEQDAKVENNNENVENTNVVNESQPSNNQSQPDKEDNKDVNQSPQNLAPEPQQATDV